ncbi:hypothetical protein D3C79_966510 [compost metagenome]
MGLDHDEFTICLQREPFCVGDMLSVVILRRLLQQQLGRVIDGFQPWRERAYLCVHCG